MRFREALIKSDPFGLSLSKPLLLQEIPFDRLRANGISHRFLGFLAAWALCFLLAACNGGGGGSDAPAAPGTPAPAPAPTPDSLTNVAPISIDGGPFGSASINALFVDVTVCVPGSQNCQTIDHVLVDTGSSGLRLIGRALAAPWALPEVRTPSGQLAGACGQFASGHTWGAMRSADVRIAGELASALPVQIIGDSSVPEVAPGDCSSVGPGWRTVAEMGAKGILGIGLFAEDCGVACEARAIPGVYYACSGNACTPTALPRARQAKNPVTAFSRNNNGVLVRLPAVPAGGVARLAGSLIFGIGTGTNNQPGSATVFATDARGNFTTVYKGRTMTASFIDSGSNALFFMDTSIPVCSRATDFYCPPSLLNLSATQLTRSGLSKVVSFALENPDRLSASVRAVTVGGTEVLDGNSFDWGLPFFFGRDVFVAIENRNTSIGQGPYWAW